MKLKLAILLTHALIIIGAGHGIALLVLVEVMGLAKSFAVLFGGNTTNGIPGVAATAYTALFGQLAIIFSMARKEGKLSKPAFFTGIALLWISLLILYYATKNESGIHVLNITWIPFGICTLWALLGRLVKWRQEQ